MLAIVSWMIILSCYCQTQSINSTPQPIVCPQCNIIVLSLTSLRKQNMGIYGYFRPTTPHINSFFKDSFIFTNAYAPASLTFTDAISFFYSLSPQVHKNFERFNKNQLKSVYETNPSLPEILAKNGYKTAAFVSDEDYSYDRGVGRTFQYYFDRSYYPDYDITYKPFTYSVGTKQLLPVVNKWLRQNQKEKFMLFMQVFDMHCPYSPEGEFDKLYQSPHSLKIPFTKECFMTQKDVVKNKSNGKLLLKSLFAFMDKQEVNYYFDKNDQDYLISRYDAELNQTDYNLNALFDLIKSLKLDKNTIIVLMADHGDNLGDNQFFMKMSSTARGNLQRNNLGLPLLITAPGLKNKGAIKQDQVIQSIDIAPSLLAMVGLKPSDRMQGKSFNEILGTNKDINDYAYAFSIRYDLIKIGEIFKTSFTLESLIGKDWKLDYSKETDLIKLKTKSEQYYLYHLSNDPSEKIDLARTNPQKVDDLKKVLESKRTIYSKVP